MPSYDFLKLYWTYQNLKIWYFGYHSSSSRLRSISNLLLPRAQQKPAIRILKKSVLPKSGRSGALLGLNFRFFFLVVYGHVRAAGVPMGPLWLLLASRTPPGRIKLLDLREKQAKMPIFFYFAKKDRFFRFTFCVLVILLRLYEYTVQPAAPSAILK